MKHAGPQALDRLEPLIARIRDLPGLVEKTRGTFYRKSRPFLHFHEDPRGLFADIRMDGDDFERIDVSDPDGADRLVAMARAWLEA
ncbi:hypothetical protein [Caulobacter sp. UNC279MFTsu5.1]|uniref:hypothetical protein n=1 Tax=Caulobacter sp. UNC279MFTsu5.1 TaxID=1502775 RepID=UPI0008EF7AD2|nr:hypothetical protein [Caulobacter sp. UNC279MFTsu5.1]SFK09658.1 hypothetical protein SAMN02799626_03397 [Caulobacter sp. UNC279MFTsu5.1]